MNFVLAAGGTGGHMVPAHALAAELKSRGHGVLLITDEIDEVICDDTEACKRMGDLVGQISKRSKGRIQHYTGSQPIFATHNIQKQIDDAVRPQLGAVRRSALR